MKQVRLHTFEYGKGSSIWHSWAGCLTWAPYWLDGGHLMWDGWGKNSPIWAVLDVGNV